jgi:hypothetical protein
MNYKVIDNFLEQDVFLKLKKNILENENFSWKLVNTVSTIDSNDGIFFVNLLYFYEGVVDEDLSAVKPIMDKLNIKDLWRIKVNLYPKDCINYRYINHIDFDYSHTGCIFYLNTNNGKTILNDVVEIDSVENRALFFDPSQPHTSTNCTDKNYRSNIIFNYR